METLGGLDMETTEEIRGKELPPSLRKRFNVRSRDYLTVTVKVRENKKHDIENVGDGIIKGLEELLHAKKNGIELQDAEDFLRTL